ncbi:MAG TPA: CopG family antitoxin [Tepidiformaceae bacterium]|nr:CopG family antitoxin [Tepidiformaceae bacterium]
MKAKTILTEMHSWDEVPEFRTEAEEADFWASHSLGEELLVEDPNADPDFPRPRSRTKPVSFRFDGDTLSRLKVVAKKKHTGYQTLAKQFVLERLYEEEKREGIIGDREAS